MGLPHVLRMLLMAVAFGAAGAFHGAFRLTVGGSAAQSPIRVPVVVGEFPRAAAIALDVNHARVIGMGAAKDPAGSQSGGVFACSTTLYPLGSVFYLFTPNLDHLANDQENFGGLMTEVHICDATKAPGETNNCF